MSRLGNEPDLQQHNQQTNEELIREVAILKFMIRRRNKRVENQMGALGQQLGMLADNNELQRKRIRDLEKQLEILMKLMKSITPTPKLSVSSSTLFISARGRNEDGVPASVSDDEAAESLFKIS